jgi:hypothetical protein
MIVKKFIAGIFMEVYQSRLASRKLFIGSAMGPADKHTGHHIGRVPESSTGMKN